MHRLDHDEVSTIVGAGPKEVFDLVSDVTRTPQWSPQVVGCDWLDEATHAAVGTRFAGRNRLKWFRWTNYPVITAVDPARRFAFARTERGGGTIEWYWRLAPAADGTEVTLGYVVLRPVPVMLHLILRLFFGVRDLHADLHQNMTASLDRLPAILTTATVGSQART